MLTLLDPTRSRGGRISRRDALYAGALALGGLSLADVLRFQARGESASPRGKSVIMIWLRGGPSHIDSYDMKPAAPPAIRGEFQPISTYVPGIEFCEYMPKQAAIMDMLA